MSKASDAAREWWMNNPSSLDLTYSDEEHPSDELVIGALSAAFEQHAAEAVAEERAKNDPTKPMCERELCQGCSIYAEFAAIRRDTQEGD